MKPSGVFFVIYGVSDCPACLMACAAAMDYYPKFEYVFVNMDFGESIAMKLNKNITITRTQSLFLQKMVAKLWWEVMMNL